MHDHLHLVACVHCEKPVKVCMVEYFPCTSDIGIFHLLQFANFRAHLQLCIGDRAALASVRPFTHLSAISAYCARNLPFQDVENGQSLKITEQTPWVLFPYNILRRVCLQTRVATFQQISHISLFFTLLHLHLYSVPHSRRLAEEPPIAKPSPVHEDLPVPPPEKKKKKTKKKSKPKVVVKPGLSSHSFICRSMILSPFPKRLYHPLLPLSPSPTCCCYHSRSISSTVVHGGVRKEAFGTIKRE